MRRDLSCFDIPILIITIADVKNVAKVTNIIPNKPFDTTVPKYNGIGIVNIVTNAIGKKTLCI